MFLASMAFLVPTIVFGMNKCSLCSLFINLHPSSMRGREGMVTIQEKILVINITIISIYISLAEGQKIRPPQK